MIKDHDGKLNTDVEPMIDEEIEQAYLAALEMEVPDLWNRIEAGLDAAAQNAPTAASSDPSASDSNVVMFDRDRSSSKGSGGAGSDDSLKDGGSHYSGSGRRNSMWRTWGGVLVAAAILIVVCIPAIRTIRQAKSETASNESTQAATVAAKDESTDYAGAPEAAAEDGSDAMAGGYYEEAEAEDEEGMVMESTTAAATEASAQAAAETQAATEAAVESAWADTNDSNTKGDGTDNKNKNSVSGVYAGDDVYLSYDFKMPNISGVIYEENGEYYIKDWSYVLGDGQKLDMIKFRDAGYDVHGLEIAAVGSEPLKISNPEDSGVVEYMDNAEQNADGNIEITVTAKFSVEKDEKNVKNEVEIVEIR